MTHPLVCFISSFQEEDLEFMCKKEQVELDNKKVKDKVDEEEENENM